MENENKRGTEKENAIFLLSIPESMHESILYTSKKYDREPQDVLKQSVKAGLDFLKALEGDIPVQILLIKEEEEIPLTTFRIPPKTDMLSAHEEESIKNYSVEIPTILLLELKKIAKERNVEVDYLLYSFLQLGITIDEINEGQEAKFIVREDGQEDKALALF
jgi:hypothetical protein